MGALRAVDHREQNSVTTEPTTDREVWQTPDRRIFDALYSIQSCIQKRLTEIGSLVSPDSAFTIQPHLDTMLTMAGSTSTLDYDIYNLRRPETRTLLFLLTRLANLNLLSPKGWPAMFELSILVMSWRMPREPPRRWEKLLKHEELEDLALYHIRLAMASLLGAL